MIKFCGSKKCRRTGTVCFCSCRPIRLILLTGLWTGISQQLPWQAMHDRSSRLKLSLSARDSPECGGARVNCESWIVENGKLRQASGGAVHKSQANRQMLDMTSLKSRNPLGNPLPHPSSPSRIRTSMRHVRTSESVPQCVYALSAQAFDKIDSCSTVPTDAFNTLTILWFSTKQSRPEGG